MTTTNVPALTGDRCLCPTCRLPFQSTEDFDRHRIGHPATPARRCKTPEELTASGWGTNREGFWMRRPSRSRMGENDAERLRRRRAATLAA